VTTVNREEVLLDAFATLADSLVADYDVLDLLQTLVETCAAALDVSQVGLLLSNASGELELVASTSESSALVETIAIGASEGPCIDAFTASHVVSVADVTDGQEWPAFRTSAAEQGFSSVICIPLKLRDTTIGTLNLFRTEAGLLNNRDFKAAQALAHVATIGILQERALRKSDEIRSQLEFALNSRVVIEQAKGVLAHTHQISTEAAFDAIRAYARKNRQPLALVARGLVDRTLSI
jgi:transcriptional regulator with GAF, ATPase, and Fis domain